MRPIDADKLKELLLKERDAIPTAVVERYSFGVPMPNKHGDAIRGGIRKALRCMEQTPTITYADLVPHGRWEVKVFSLTSCKKVVCSECGYSEQKGPAWEPSWGMPNYCPSCGARMDGGSGDGK